ncbi:hypothetical protein OH687_34865 [Burkholderia anthina]|nr:hypothetical protein OH687_34865 [Burkholderia anthina]
MTHEPSDARSDSYRPGASIIKVALWQQAGSHAADRVVPLANDAQANANPLVGDFECTQTALSN